MSKDYDIVIVGAGIVGSCLASLLAHSSETKGLSIAVIDAGSEGDIQSANRQQKSGSKQFDPRVVALSESSREILSYAGAWADIISSRACPYYRMHVWDAEGTGSISFDASSSQSEELGHICENNSVVSALLEALRTAPNTIDLYFEEKLSHIVLSENIQAMPKVRHKLEFESGLELSADLVVGADGANSTLRQQAGLRTKEWDYKQSAIVTTIKTEKPHEFCAWQRFSQLGPLALLPLSDDGEDQHYCSVVWSIESDRAELFFNQSDEAFCQSLGEYSEFKLGQIQWVDKRFQIPLRQRFATRYIRPGLALVGDAAHTIHPLAGQGVNLGLYDVKVLAEEIINACKLNRPLTNRTMLRRFERQRQPHNFVTMLGMEAFKRGFSSDSLAVRWLRNSGLNLVDRHPLIKQVFSQFAAGNVRDV